MFSFYYSTYDRKFVIMHTNSKYFVNGLCSVFIMFYLLVTQQQCTAATTLEQDITCGNVTCYGPQTARCDQIDSVLQCLCRTGFDGLTCHEDNNECSGNHQPCGHRGECTNSVGSFNCRCLKGWQGDHCQQAVGDVRECMPGWELPMCNRDIDECSNTSLFTCGINQHCRNTFGNFTCECNDGWEGFSCEDDINECALNPCNNNGTCTNYNGSFSCQCPDEWVGIYCASNINDCMNNTCRTNETCLSVNGTFLCKNINNVSVSGSSRTETTHYVQSNGKDGFGVASEKLAANTNTLDVTSMSPRPYNPDSEVVLRTSGSVAPVAGTGAGTTNAGGNFDAKASTGDKSTPLFKDGVSVMLVIVGSAFAILTFMAGFGIAVRIFKPSIKGRRVRDIPHSHEMDDYA